ncbi:hypothetical protein [Thalassobaculum sp.]|uniref:hypothetical protein n=1 Tax=Thalassobaculum sp. TaxID=2022740 RepID=UPI0032F06F4E
MSAGEPKGEGSYEGTRRYNKATREFVKTHDVDKLAEKAKDALENDDGTLRKAEKAGKSHAKA